MAASRKNAGKKRNINQARSKVLRCAWFPSDTSILARELRGLFLSMALKREFYETIDQLGICQAALLPHLGIPADGRKAGNGVDFVDVELPGGALQQKIDARHSLALDGTVTVDGETPQFRRLILRQIRRQLEFCLIEKVLIFVVVELARGKNLAGQRSLWLLI